MTKAFFIDEWLIEPSLNRVTRDARRQQIEPKMMQVLCYLAGAGHEVV